jgi:drug/metabolite transporter (DMT)-like permease
MGVAGLILSPALFLAIRRQRGFLRRHAMIILGFGLIPVLGCQLFFFSAMQRMPVAVALLIQYLAPVMLVAFVWMRTRRAPSSLVLWGSAVAIVGLVLVVDISGASFDLLGTLFALAAAVCVCVYFVISERAGADLPPLALAAGGLLTGAIFMAVLCLTGIMPFEAPAVSVVLAGIEVPWFVPLLWVAGVATTVGYAFGVMAVPRIGSRVASFVGLSEVLFALGFAWLFLAEVPAPIQFAGGALILVGVVLVRADAQSSSTPRERASLPSVPAP